MANEKPNFDLVTLTPPMVYGPLLHTVKSVSDLNQSTSRIYDLFINSTASAPLPPNGMHVYTDVRDLAQAHLNAITTPAASGKRFIICAGQVSSQEIVDFLREKFEVLKERTPVGVNGGNKLDPNAYICSNEQAKKVLGVSFRSKEETFVDLAKQLLEIEAKEKA